MSRARACPRPATAAAETGTEAGLRTGAAGPILAVDECTVGALEMTQARDACRRAAVLAGRRLDRSCPRGADGAAVTPSTLRRRWHEATGGGGVPATVSSTGTTCMPTARGVKSWKSV